MPTAEAKPSPAPEQKAVAAAPAPAEGQPASPAPAPLAASPGLAETAAVEKPPAPPSAQPAPGGPAKVSAKPPAAAKGARPPPRGPKTLLAEAKSLRDRNQPEAALDVYAKVLSTDLGNADALAGRGACYFDLSQYGPAEASFKAAIESDPLHPGALMGLAETYRYEGRTADALAYYRRYLSAHPKGDDAVAARNAVDTLSSKE
ncbi:MAG TPA: tetratricopeptide repeat protein [Anaeromyxobacteraceae bacterium]|nr:tetratricopeptide repeat protein [Anaeromyxobacteraceae bacterium]